MSDLTTLTNVKAYLGTTSATTDTVLSSLISAASAFVEKYCQRTFASQSYTETRNGNGGYRLVLANQPVTAIASVTVDGSAITPPLSQGAFGYLFTDSMVLLQGGAFCRGVQNVTVTYTAGFTTIPLDIAQAVNEIVGVWFAKRTRLDQRSETLAQQTIAYDTSDVPAYIKAVLDNYRMVYSPR